MAVDGSRLLVTFEEHLRAAATSRWRGSVSFPDRIVCALARRTPVLDTLWRLGAVDLGALAEELGSELCAVDAKRARGEYRGPSGHPCELEPDDSAVADWVLLSRWWWLP